MDNKQPLRQAFTFYISFEEALSCLDDHEELVMRRAISRYALYGETPNLTGPLMGMFLSWKPNIDASNVRRDASSENGKKGGRPRKDKNLEKPSDNLEEPSDNLEEPSDNLEKGNINIKENTNKKLNDKENVNTGSAGPDSRSRPCIKEERESNFNANIDVEAEENWEKIETTKNEKMSLSRFMPPEGLRDATPEEIEENNQKKVLALQKLRQEVNK